MMHIDFSRTNNNGCPCMDCPDREVGCHGKCNAYQTWRKGVDEKREAEYQAKKPNNVISDTSIRRIWRKQRWSYQQTRRRSGKER